MKTRFISRLVLLLALLGAVSSILSASSSDAPAFALPVRQVELERYTVEPGTSALKVIQFMGAPNQKLSEDLWVYYGHGTAIKEAVALNCNILLITIKGSQVAEIKLVNKQATKIIAEGIKMKSATHVASSQ